MSLNYKIPSSLTQKIFGAFLTLFCLLNFIDNSYSMTQEDDQLSRQNKIVPYRQKIGIDEQTGETLFDWQNRRHYEELVRIFETLSERELNSTINRIINIIDLNDKFFTHRYELLLEELREIIYNWMNEDILTDKNYWNEGSTYTEREEDYDSESDDSMEPWEKAFVKGFEREGSENEEDSEEEGFYDDMDLSDEEDDEEEIEKWKLGRREDLLGLTFENLNEFTLRSISIKAIKRFLEDHTQDGYSWLINEIVEGSLSSSEDFVEDISRTTDIPSSILESIFGGFWFYFDWEEEDIRSPAFITKVYINTLHKFQKGEIARDTKTRVLLALKSLFTFNSGDFMKPFEGIRNRYEAFATENNWKAALIEWSVYTTYRKIFIDSERGINVAGLTSIECPLPVVRTFNRSLYLKDCLEKALTRARQVYTKVYPHPQTTKVIYSSKKAHKKATLDLEGSLRYLKGIGQYWEPKRNLGSENVFVPMLCFIVSNQTHVQDGEHGRVFINVPLHLPGLPRRPLTCSNADGIFKDKFDMKAKDSYYFNGVRREVVKGKVIMGLDETQATQDLESTINNKGLCCPYLVHSERVLIEAGRNPQYVEAICDNLAQNIQRMGQGEYKVYGTTLLGYSTNTVCKYCTPSIVAFQNSNDNNGFLGLLVQKLNNYNKQGISFKVRGYDFQRASQDFSKFRLNTFVTASVNFDEQANDLAEEGQHQHTRNNKPPKTTHNPHARLFFPNNEIDLHKAPLSNGTLEPTQSFFYEFVGKDVHAGGSQEEALRFQGALFSSSSKPWKTTLRQ